MKKLIIAIIIVMVAVMIGYSLIPIETEMVVEGGAKYTETVIDGKSIEVGQKVELGVEPNLINTDEFDEGLERPGAVDLKEAINMLKEIRLIIIMIISVIGITILLLFGESNKEELKKE